MDSSDSSAIDAATARTHQKQESTTPTSLVSFSKPLLPLNSSLLRPTSPAPAADTNHNGATYSGNAGGLPEQYWECLRNHAVGFCGRILDGCRKFIPGDGDSSGALYCAACGCHRSFHRLGASACTADGGEGCDGCAVADQCSKEDTVFAEEKTTATPGDCARRKNKTRKMAAAGDLSKKRHRTRFTVLQKERMREFAGTLGWKVGKHDGEAVEKFCNEVGVTLRVLKVWMNNNKNLQKQQE